jgi:hypothetical protein
MKNCPHCTAPVNDEGATCGYCGGPIGEDNGAVARTTPNPSVSTDKVGPDPRAVFARWKMGAIGASAGVIVVALLVGRSVSPPAASVEAKRQLTAQSTASAPLARDASETPSWVGQRRAAWARDGSKTIAFQIQAEKAVSVWMRQLMPVLAVRCLSYRTEVFVVTGSTSIESERGVHTVRLQFDNELEEEQHWLGSETNQELFAPDGEAFSKRLARATRLRVGFSPYNASPVTADFYVAGYDELHKLVASTCSWRPKSNVQVRRGASSRSSALSQMSGGSR